MQVLVDTSVWSCALRRPKLAADSPNVFGQTQWCVEQLRELIADSRAVLIGPIRQELLSGVKTTEQFEQLRGALDAFPDLGIDTVCYPDAARLFNQCRRAGIQGSHIDFLICAVAIHHKLPIFTLDHDFDQYQKQISIALFERS